MRLHSRSFVSILLLGVVSSVAATGAETCPKAEGGVTCQIDFSKYPSRDARLALRSRGYSGARTVVALSPSNYATKLASIPASNVELVLSNGTWNGVDLRVNGHNILIRPQSPKGVTFTGLSRLSVTGSDNIVYDLQFLGGDFVPGSVRADGAIISNKNSNILIRLGDSDADLPCNKCILSDINIDDVGSHGPTSDVYASTAGTYVAVYGIDDSVVYSTFRGMKDHGHMLESGDLPPGATRQGLYVYRNLFTGKKWPGDFIYGNSKDKFLPNGYETIQLGGLNYGAPEKSTYGRDLYSVIEENLISDCEETMSLLTLKAGGVQIKNNTFLNNGGPVLVRSANDVYIGGNLFQGSFASNISGGGLSLSGSGHLVTNNYFADNPSTSVRPLRLIAGHSEDINLEALSPSDNDERGVPRLKNTIISNNVFYNDAQPIGWALEYGIGRNKVFPLGYHLSPAKILFKKNVFYNDRGLASEAQFVLPNKRTYAEYMLWGADLNYGTVFSPEEFWAAPSGGSPAQATNRFVGNTFVAANNGIIRTSKLSNQSKAALVTPVFGNVFLSAGGTPPTPPAALTEDDVGYKSP